VRVDLLLTHAERQLSEAGCDTPRLDAQILLADLLKVERVALFSMANDRISDTREAAFYELVKRRQLHEPVAYIVGRKEFWSMSFKVDSRVLIPRPDTETLIEEARDLFLSKSQQPENMIFADVGTGSGCIACALADLFVDARGVAIDLSQEVLDLARENITDLGFSDRLETRQGHLVEPLEDGYYSLICSNPPYIPSKEIDKLTREIRCFEPLLALDGGQDGLDSIKELIVGAKNKLSANGWLLIEVGDGQAEQVVGLCQDAGYGQVHTRCDLSKVARVVAAKHLFR
jgi:release factor glutamine methyltransferase